MNLHLSARSVEELSELSYECECGKRHGGFARLRFGRLSALSEEINVFVPLGKLVILASGETFLRCGSVLREALRRYKLLTALDVTDVSSLFAFDDGIAGVVALGTEAAELGRYFAGVRNLPCIAIPDVICSERLLGETVDVPLGGKRVVYPAPPPRLIYVDVSLLCGAAEAYGKICSWALSLLDLRFSPDDQPRCGELYELALSALGGLGWYESDGVQKIFESDFRLAYCAREGLERGAVRVLAEETGSDLFALVKLAKVYELFFRKGYARPYAAPDYVERAERAGVRPHPLFCRADAFYADFLRERRGYLAGVREILSRLPNMKRTYFQLGGKGVRVEGEALRRAVDLLPEKCGKGPLVWMREFGLLEGLCKGRCKS